MLGHPAALRRSLRGEWLWVLPAPAEQRAGMMICLFCFLGEYPVLTRSGQELESLMNEGVGRMEEDQRSTISDL